MNYQASGGYSIAAINVVNFMYEYTFIALPRLTSNFIWLHYNVSIEELIIW